MKATDGFKRSIDNPGAVINTDNAALQAYKLKKNKEKEIDVLKQDVNDIKVMLAAILNKLG
jgi:hypothetical protein